MTVLGVDQVMQSVRQLPSLSSVVMQLLELFSHDDPDIAAVGRAFDRDQALAARVLRIANSPFYGMPGQVVSVHNAMVVLGQRNLHNLTLAAAVTGSFPVFESGWFDQKIFWQHSLVVGQSADVLASCIGRHQESAFTAGLLHDIGRLVLVTCFPEHSRKVALHQKTHDCSCSQAEHEVLRLDHALVGAALAQRWNFAEVIQESIALHHEPSGNPPGAAGLADLVHLADVTAHALDLCGDPGEMVPRLDAEAWGRLGMPWPNYRHALAEIERRSADAGSLLAA
ncbi:MAG: putative domain HDIG-containing protein [Betaproteobacteria bacterium]|nr:putative domain HDIG-containing protein [Betaproteobacteria bacterium]